MVVDDHDANKDMQPLKIQSKYDISFTFSYSMRMYNFHNIWFINAWITESFETTKDHNFRNILKSSGWKNLKMLNFFQVQAWKLRIYQRSLISSFIEETNSMPSFTKWKTLVLKVSLMKLQKDEMLFFRILNLGPF